MHTVIPKLTSLAIINSFPKTLTLTINRFLHDTVYV